MSVKTTKTLCKAHADKLGGATMAYLIAMTGQEYSDPADMKEAHALQKAFHECCEEGMDPEAGRELIKTLGCAGAAPMMASFPDKKLATATGLLPEKRKVQKSHVEGHTRTVNGKLIQVHEHETKVQKKSKEYQKAGHYAVEAGKTVWKDKNPEHDTVLAHIGQRSHFGEHKKDGYFIRAANAKDAKVIAGIVKDVTGKDPVKKHKGVIHHGNDSAFPHFFLGHGPEAANQLSIISGKLNHMGAMGNGPEPAVVEAKTPAAAEAPKPATSHNIGLYSETAKTAQGHSLGAAAASKKADSYTSHWAASNAHAVAADAHAQVAGVFTGIPNASAQHQSIADTHKEAAEWHKSEAKKVHELTQEGASLEAAGYTPGKDGYSWGKKVQTDTSSFRHVNVRHAGNPLRWHVKSNVTFTNGITGTPTEEVGVFDSETEALAAAEKKLGKFQPKKVAEEPEPAPKPPTSRRDVMLGLGIKDGYDLEGAVIDVDKVFDVIEPMKPKDAASSATDLIAFGVGGGGIDGSHAAMLSTTGSACYDDDNLQNAVIGCRNRAKVLFVAGVLAGYSGDANRGSLVTEQAKGCEKLARFWENAADAPSDVRVAMQNMGGTEAYTTLVPGATKTMGGVTYRFNENHRWEKVEDDKKADFEGHPMSYLLLNIRHWAGQKLANKDGSVTGQLMDYDRFGARILVDGEPPKVHDYSWSGLETLGWHDTGEIHPEYDENQDHTLPPPGKAPAELIPPAEPTPFNEDHSLDKFATFESDPKVGPHAAAFANFMNNLT